VWHVVAAIPFALASRQLTKRRVRGFYPPADTVALSREKCLDCGYPASHGVRWHADGCSMGPRRG
jgi:hypothetical protein